MVAPALLEAWPAADTASVLRQALVLPAVAMASNTDDLASWRMSVTLTSSHVGSARYELYCNRWPHSSKSHSEPRPLRLSESCACPTTQYASPARSPHLVF